MALTEEQLERRRVEIVFNLGGGELHEKHPDFPDEFDGHFAYWYEGVPDYAKSDLPAEAADWNLRTAIVCEVYGRCKPPVGWNRLLSFTTSGERECECVDVDEVDSATCKVCDGDKLVYLGEGWREVVFVFDENDEWLQAQRAQEAADG